MDSEDKKAKPGIIKTFKEQSKKYTGLYLVLFFVLGMGLFGLSLFLSPDSEKDSKKEHWAAKSSYLLASIFISTGGVGLLYRYSGPFKILKDLLDDYDIIQLIEKIDGKISCITKEAGVATCDYDCYYPNPNNISNYKFILALEKSLNREGKVTYSFIGIRAKWVPLILAKSIHKRGVNAYKQKFKIYLMNYFNENLANEFSADEDTRERIKNEMLATIEMFRMISVSRAKVHIYLLDYDPPIRLEAFDNGEIYYYPTSLNDEYSDTKFHGVYKYFNRNFSETRGTTGPRRPVYELLSSTINKLQSQPFWKAVKDQENKYFTLWHTNITESDDIKMIIKKAKELDKHVVRDDFIGRWDQFYKKDNDAYKEDNDAYKEDNDAVKKDICKKVFNFPDITEDKSV